MTLVSNRVGTFAQRSSLIQQITDLQKRLYTSQTQVATEQKSQNYTGISSDSFRLVKVETEITKLEFFTKSNNIAQTRLNSMATAINSLQDRLHTIHNTLIELNVQDVNQALSADETSTIREAQEYAFAAMQDIAYYLNTQGDGGYLFSGGRSDQKAVDFPYGTLDEFQAAYDGSNITFPTTRTANVPDVKITQAQHGGLTFGPNTITPAVGFETSTASLTPGTVIELTDGSMTTQRFTVTAQNSGTGALTVTPDPSALTATNATITGVSYYKGDSLEYQHRVGEDRSIELGINAKNPAFEKAFRALGMLAQGGLDTASTTTLAATTGTLTFDNAAGTVTAATGGSLAGLPIGSAITFPGTANNATQTFTIVSNDGTTMTLDPPPTAEPAIAADAVTDNLGRIQKAMTLLGDAMDHNSNLASESTEDIEQVARIIGFNQVTLDNAITDAQTMDSYLKVQMGKLENVNLLDAATRLQDDSLALEASMSTYSRISKISLLSYL